MDLLRGVIDFVNGFPWVDAFFTVRLIFIVLDIALVVLFIYLFIQSLKFRPSFVFNPISLAKRKKLVIDKRFGEGWKKVLTKARKSPPQSLFLGIIEADGFVDSVLKKINIPGEHMADRLERLAVRNLKTIDRLWRAHKVRNDLAHTPGFTIDPRDAEQILGDYEAFLKEIGAI